MDDNEWKLIFGRGYHLIVSELYSNMIFLSSNVIEYTVYKLRRARNKIKRAQVLS